MHSFLSISLLSVILAGFVWQSTAQFSDAIHSRCAALPGACDGETSVHAGRTASHTYPKGGLIYSQGLEGYQLRAPIPKDDTSHGHLIRKSLTDDSSDNTFYGLGTLGDLAQIREQHLRSRNAGFQSQRQVSTGSIFRRQSPKGHGYGYKSNDRKQPGQTAREIEELRKTLPIEKQQELERLRLLKDAAYQATRNARQEGRLNDAAGHIQEDIDLRKAMLVQWGNIGIGRAGHEEQIRQLLINKQRLEAGHRNVYETATNAAAVLKQNNENKKEETRVVETQSLEDFSPPTKQRKAASKAEKAWAEAMSKSAKVPEDNLSSGSRESN